MARLNITLNQDEILQLLSVDREDAFRVLLQDSLNSILKIESQEQLRAAPYERSDVRTDSRNGFRSRDLKTRIGTITRNVPRHRNQLFHTMVFENYSRSEAALVTSMAEMVVSGVSARKVARVVAHRSPNLPCPLSARISIRKSRHSGTGRSREIIHSSRSMPRISRCERTVALFQRR